MAIDPITVGAVCYAHWMWEHIRLFALYGDWDKRVRGALDQAELWRRYGD